MKIVRTPLPDLLVIEPKVFGDERGFFMESWNARTFAASGLDVAFVQDNHSRSARGVLRGLHYQKPNAQGKLVRVVAGAVFDVAVDLRRASSTFGKWFGLTLSAQNKKMLWVPAGFAHGFLSLEDETDFIYKCTSVYSPADEHCLRWDDPAIGVEWPRAGIRPALSAKDQAGVALADAVVFE